MQNSLPKVPRIRVYNPYVPATVISSVQEMIEQNKLRTLEKRNEANKPYLFTDVLFNQRIRNYYREKYDRSFGTEVTGRLIGAGVGAAKGAYLGGIIAGVTTAVTMLFASALTPDMGTLAVAAIPAGKAITAAINTGSKIGAIAGGAAGAIAGDYSTTYASRDLINNVIVEPYRQGGIAYSALKGLYSVGKSMDVLSGGETIRASIYAKVTNTDPVENIMKAYGLHYSGRTSYDFEVIRKELGIDLGRIPNFAIDLLGDLLTDPGFISAIGSMSLGKTSAKNIAKEIASNPQVKSIVETSESLTKLVKEAETNKTIMKQLSRAVLDENPASIIKMLNATSPENGAVDVIKKFVEETKSAAYKNVTNTIAGALGQIDHIDDQLTFAMFNIIFPPTAVIRFAPKIVRKFASDTLLNSENKFQSFFKGVDMEYIYRKSIIKNSAKQENILSNLLFNDIGDFSEGFSIKDYIRLEKELSEIKNTKSTLYKETKIRFDNLRSQIESKLNELYDKETQDVNAKILKRNILDEQYKSIKRNTNKKANFKIQIDDLNAEIQKHYESIIQLDIKKAILNNSREIKNYKKLVKNMKNKFAVLKVIDDKGIRYAKIIDSLKTDIENLYKFLKNYENTDLLRVFLRTNERKFIELIQKLVDESIVKEISKPFENIKKLLIKQKKKLAKEIDYNNFQNLIKEYNNLKSKLPTVKTNSKEWQTIKDRLTEMDEQFENFTISIGEANEKILDKFKVLEHQTGLFDLFDGSRKIDIEPNTFPTFYTDTMINRTLYDSVKNAIDELFKTTGKDKTDIINEEIYKEFVNIINNFSSSCQESAVISRIIDNIRKYLQDYKKFEIVNKSDTTYKLWKESNPEDILLDTSDYHNELGRVTTEIENLERKFDLSNSETTKKIYANRIEKFKTYQEELKNEILKQDVNAKILKRNILDKQYQSIKRNTNKKANLKIQIDDLNAEIQKINNVKPKETIYKTAKYRATQTKVAKFYDNNSKAYLEYHDIESIDQLKNKLREIHKEVITSKMFTSKSYMFGIEQYNNIIGFIDLLDRNIADIDVYKIYNTQSNNFIKLYEDLRKTLISLIRDNKSISLKKLSDTYDLLNKYDSIQLYYAINQYSENTNRIISRYELKYRQLINQKNSLSVKNDPNYEIKLEKINQELIELEKNKLEYKQNLTTLKKAVDDLFKKEDIPNFINKEFLVMSYLRREFENISNDMVSEYTLLAKLTKDKTILNKFFQRAIPLASLNVEDPFLKAFKKVLQELSESIIKLNLGTPDMFNKQVELQKIIYDLISQKKKYDLLEADLGIKFDIKLNKDYKIESATIKGFKGPEIDGFIKEVLQNNDDPFASSSFIKKYSKEQMILENPKQKNIINKWFSDPKTATKKSYGGKYNVDKFIESLEDLTSGITQKNSAVLHKSIQFNNGGLPKFIYIFDTETSAGGQLLNQAMLLQFTIKKYAVDKTGTLKLIDQNDIFIDPKEFKQASKYGFIIDKKAMDVNKITLDKLKENKIKGNTKTIEEIYSYLLNKETGIFNQADSMIVAHNAEFDMGILFNNYLRTKEGSAIKDQIGNVFDDVGKITENGRTLYSTFDNNIVDSLALSRAYPYFDTSDITFSKNNSELAKAAGVPYTKTYYERGEVNFKDYVGLEERYYFDDTNKRTVEIFYNGKPLHDADIDIDVTSIWFEKLYRKLKDNSTLAIEKNPNLNFYDVISDPTAAIGEQNYNYDKVIKYIEEQYMGNKLPEIIYYVLNNHKNISSIDDIIELSTELHYNKQKFMANFVQYKDRSIDFDEKLTKELDVLEDYLNELEEQYHSSLYLFNRFTNRKNLVNLKLNTNIVNLQLLQNGILYNESFRILRDVITNSPDLEEGSGMQFIADILAKVDHPEIIKLRSYIQDIWESALWQDNILKDLDTGNGQLDLFFQLLKEAEKTRKKLAQGKIDIDKFSEQLFTDLQTLIYRRTQNSSFISQDVVIKIINRTIECVRDNKSISMFAESDVSNELFEKIKSNIIDPLSRFMSTQVLSSEGVPRQVYDTALDEFNKEFREALNEIRYVLSNAKQENRINRNKFYDLNELIMQTKQKPFDLVNKNSLHTIKYPHEFKDGEYIGTPIRDSNKLKKLSNDPVSDLYTKTENKFYGYNDVQETKIYQRWAAIAEELEVDTNDFLQFINEQKINTKQKGNRIALSFWNSIIKGELNLSDDEMKRIKRIEALIDSIEDMDYVTDMAEYKNRLRIAYIHGLFTYKQDIINARISRPELIRKIKNSVNTSNKIVSSIKNICKTPDDLKMFFSKRPDLRLAILDDNNKVRLLKTSDTETLQYFLDDADSQYFITGKDEYLNILHDLGQKLEISPVLRSLHNAIIYPIKFVSLLFSAPFVIQNVTAATLQNLTEHNYNFISTIGSLTKTAETFNLWKHYFNDLTSDKRVIEILGNTEEVEGRWIELLTKQDSNEFIKLPSEIQDYIKKLNPKQIKEIKELNEILSTNASFGELKEIQRNYLKSVLKKERIQELKSKSNLTLEEETELYTINDTPNNSFKTLEEEYNDLKEKARNKLLKDDKDYARYYSLRYKIGNESNKFIAWMQKIKAVKRWTEINSDIETIFRAEMIKTALKQGYDISEATQKVISKHFIYSDKAEYMKWLEVFFPFANYPIKATKLFNDYLGDYGFVKFMYTFANNSWGDEDEDLENGYLLGRKSKGDIPMDGRLYNFGNPLLENISNIMDPVKAANNKLNPLFKPVVDLATGAQYNRYTQLPGVSVINNAQKTVKEYNNTGELHPGTFLGTSKPYYDRNYYTKNVYRRYPQRPTIYKSLYTSGGYSRVEMRMKPTNLNNVSYRVTDILNQYKYR
ncbi:MAG TPA: hypothetical protein PK626_00625 [Bacteroidales bacterium]|nr:hypothetical protein [Bacteroidales bacterium]